MGTEISSAPIRLEPVSGLRSRWFDGLVASGTTLLSISILSSFLNDVPGWIGILAVILTLIHTLSLFWRRRTPWLALGANLASGFAIVALGLPMVVLGLAPLIALYSVAARDSRDRSLWGLGAVITLLFIAELLSGFAEDPSTIAVNLVAVSSAWLIGSFVHTRELGLTQLKNRTRELEIARDELARTVVTEERLRIARELHDVVAHALSLITIQSGVGAYVIEDNPQEALQSLRAVETVSRQALNEMRRLLGVLREDTDQTLLPPRGLSEIEELVQQVSSLGTKVDLQTHGRPRALSPGLDLTAFRIVQESLTNVIKHSGASRARVVLRYDDDRLVMEVVDNGHGSTPDAGIGHGIAGMRERAALFGGSIEVGPLADGGFRVQAELPLNEDTS